MLMLRPICGNWKNVFFLLATILFIFHELSVFNVARVSNCDARKKLTYDEYLKENHKPKFVSSEFSVASRLGNHLFELVSFLGIAKRLGRIPLFLVKNKKYQKWLNNTESVFPGLVAKLSIVNGWIPAEMDPIYFPRECCTYDDPSRIINMTDSFLHLSGRYYQSYKFFNTSRQFIIDSLVKNKTQKFLPEPDDATSVTCIHVRRTDFKNHARFMASEDFIRKSAMFIVNRKQTDQRKTSIVLFGDDQKFMKNIFPASTRHFVSKNSPVEDLVYASKHCDNVLITSPISTFGWWLGFLSGHDNVFYTDVKKVNEKLVIEKNLTPEDFYPPEWTPLWWSADNKTVVESR